MQSWKQSWLISLPIFLVLLKNTTYSTFKQQWKWSRAHMICFVCLIELYVQVWFRVIPLLSHNRRNVFATAAKEQ